MSKIKRIGAGARMSKAVVHGDTVYTAGQVADRTKGGSVKEQTREILGLIDAILAETGGDKSKILRDDLSFRHRDFRRDEWRLGRMGR